MDDLDRYIMNFQEKLELINQQQRAVPGTVIRQKLRPNYGLDWIEDLRRRLKHEPSVSESSGPESCQVLAQAINQHQPSLQSASQPEAAVAAIHC